MMWSLIKPLLFKIDAEDIHLNVIQNIRRFGPFFLKNSKSDIKKKKAFGMTFRNPIGLAAGFDKNAEILKFLPQFGFGFAEIGTVTPRPQEGNSRPRLFRIPKEKTIFNRMGFNGDGAFVVSERIKSQKSDLPEDFRVGINIGKNKVTPNEEAAIDYQKAIIPFEGIVDYVVINVSSPNTPGLRDLQTVAALEPIIDSVQSVIQKWKTVPPLLLKLAPEAEIETLISHENSWGITGWVLTNTLAGTFLYGKDHLPGGLSGQILQEKSRTVLKNVKKQSEKSVISVGGIMNREEAQTRLDLGADLIQIYSGWIYQGPFFPRDLVKSL